MRRVWPYLHRHATCYVWTPLARRGLSPVSLRGSFFHYATHKEAIVLSLGHVQKARGLEPYSYLRYLFEHLPAATTDAQRKALLPQHLDPCSLIIPA